MHHCQPGDPAECSWGCFTPRQYCSQERGAIHSISLLIILFHICHKHCTGVIENLQNKKMMIPSRLHLMVSTVRETELLELKHWWHHQPSPTSMSSSRWALQNLGGVENSDGKWWRQYGLLRAERDYKADMEALSLEIEQVARKLLEFWTLLILWQQICRVSVR